MVPIVRFKTEDYVFMLRLICLFDELMILDFINLH